MEPEMMKNIKPVTARDLDHHTRYDPHRRASALSDIILGGQDGLVNVLGVILGVAAATADTRIVLVAGLAATFAESVSMGAVAYTSTLADADFFESERVDADFLDEGQVLPPPNTGKKPFKGRSIFMVGSALLGAIALGGALAFAYKQSGGGLSGELPLVTADNRPVKELPQDPGGKEFPHKNKLIYDRLTNGDEPESVYVTSGGIRYDAGELKPGESATVTVVEQRGRPPVIVFSRDEE